MKNNKPISYLLADGINNALSKQYRQYLTGRLTREQKHLQHIDDDIEIGVSYYKEFTSDTPHKHPVATEHCYILQGVVRVQCLEGERTKFEFHEGDFFVIEKGVAYATKNAANTKVLFIKSPGINDKEVVEIDADIKDWLSSWD